MISFTTLLSRIATVLHCAAHYDDDPWVCAVSGSKERAIPNPKQADYLPAVPNSLDRRFRAAVLVTPVGEFFAPDVLTSISVSVTTC